jgi:DNA mismatch repair protein MutL
MMPITLLPPDVANKIAAGEVVERPASVVKELLENSIDAGGHDIRVEVREGGRRLIRVQDNGSGIPAAEVELAFARHATSKLRSAEDLSTIRTLGFRGEALTSISAVSRLTIVTRAEQEQSGTRMRLEGGVIGSTERLGMPPGCTVTVENLFFNTPPRLKFLRRPATEAGHIHRVVTRYALAYPERRFSLMSDGRLVLQSSGSGRLVDVLVKVYGLETAKQMLEVGTPDDEPAGAAYAVSGYVGAPSLHRSNRQYITFYVNRRWVQDRSLAYAVIQAYHTLLPTGRFPMSLLFLGLETSAVDVNVHPRKAEVRFSDDRAVFRAVQRAVRRVLVDQSPIPTMLRRATTWPGADWERRQSLVEAGGALERSQLAMDMEGSPAPSLTSPGTDDVAGELPILRVVGQLGATYIVAEGPSGMYLVDQHAAHERVLYERLMADKAASSASSQGLLEPAPLELTPVQAAILEEHLPFLRSVGFDIEPFGGETQLLRGVPSVMPVSNPQAALAEILDGLAEGQDRLAEGQEEAVIRLVCKQSAVRAGQALSLQEMQELVQRLEQTTSPRTCPHGRPTMVHLSAQQLAKEFGRR